MVMSPMLDKRKLPHVSKCPLQHITKLHLISQHLKRNHNQIHLRIGETMIKSQKQSKAKYSIQNSDTSLTTNL